MCWWSAPRMMLVISNFTARAFLLVEGTGVPRGNDRSVIRKLEKIAAVIHCYWNSNPRPQRWLPSDQSTRPPCRVFLSYIYLLHCRLKRENDSFCCWVKYHCVSPPLYQFTPIDHIHNTYRTHVSWCKPICSCKPLYLSNACYSYVTVLFHHAKKEKIVLNNISLSILSSKMLNYY